MSSSDKSESGGKRSPQEQEADKFKEKANESMKENKYDEAVKNYNKAISLSPDNPVYYSNRLRGVRVLLCLSLTTLRGVI